MKRGVLLDPSKHMPEAMHSLNLWTQTVLVENDPDFDALADEGRPVTAVVGAPAIYAEDPDASGDDHFCEAVYTLQPELFLLETVRGLAGPRFVRFLATLEDDLGSDGRYRVGHGLVTIDGKTRLVVVGINSLKDPLIRNQGDMSDGADTISGIIRDNLRRL